MLEFLHLDVDELAEADEPIGKSPVRNGQNGAANFFVRLVKVSQRNENGELQKQRPKDEEPVDPSDVRRVPEEEVARDQFAVLHGVDGAAFAPLGRQDGVLDFRPLTNDGHLLDDDEQRAEHGEYVARNGDGEPTFQLLPAFGAVSVALDAERADRVLLADQSTSSQNAEVQKKTEHQSVDGQHRRA